MAYTFERLDVSFKDPIKAMKTVKENGGKTYLNKEKGTEIDQFSFTTEEAHKKIVNQIREGSKSSEDFNWMPFKPSSVNYREVTSPFADRWPFTYEVEPYIVPTDSLLAVDHAYRPITMFSEESSNWPRLELNFKGIFDPGKLEVSKDPLTELPMETYFPSKAEWVLDKNENPINPPKKMKPTNNPYGFLTKPPLMLTTLDAAAKVIGEKPISAIRIKVAGVDELNETSKKTLQAVATKIEAETGLITDITLGSSPQPALTHIPGVDGKKSIGWIEQPWIKLGSSVTIFQQSKVGMSGVIASVVAVAVVYVFASNIIMMYARKKEFALLLSVGWRPNQLSRLLFIEAAAIGLFVTIISWLIIGFIYVIHDVETTGLRLFIIGVIGMAIYVLGAFIPGILVRKISPYETMKTGEVSTYKKRLFKTSSIISMSLKNLLVKWKRSVLSVIAIALPTSLLIFFLFVTFQLRGTMYTTLLGGYVALEVGSMHYIAMGIATAIAILTTAEVIWQNVSERQPEIAVLKAFGWHNRTIRMLVLLEGGLSGLIAGILGLILAIGMVWGMFQQFPLEQLPFFVLTILIPIVTGIIGAVLPARKAGRVQPYQGLAGGYVNSKKTEKSFRYVISAAGICLFIGIIVLLTQAMPHVQETSVKDKSVSTNIENTKGDVQETISTTQGKSDDDNTGAADKMEGNEYYSVIQKNIEDGYNEAIIDLGETWDRGFESKFTYEKVAVPEGIKTKKKNTKLITISAEVILYVGKGNDEGALAEYQPHVGGLHLLDENGNRYERIDYQTVEAKNWNKIYLEVPGKLKSLLTYEVPKDVKKLILVDDQSWIDIFPHPIIVDITGNLNISEDGIEMDK
ncbi:FtsX-like permease family protein [Virgibacillus flavescens]|uniref:ABC transporter permease n=1 Tax=Virgibacillus flavescens TaxID=1611422 RepID=UPI003D33212E